MIFEKKIYVSIVRKVFFKTAVSEIYTAVKKKFEIIFFRISILPLYGLKMHQVSVLNSSSIKCFYLVKIVLNIMYGNQKENNL